MDTITFDKLAYIDRLTSDGIDEAHARSHAAALDTALRDTVATKADIQASETTLRQEIRDVETRLKTEIAEVRTEITEVRNELKGDIIEVRNELKGDIIEVRNELKGDIARLESRMDIMQRDLTIRLGVMMATSIAVVATLVRLL